MYEIRITINWTKETDQEVLDGIMKQPGISMMATPAGDWIYREGRLIGVRHQGIHYFKQTSLPADYSNMHTAEAPPSRAQRTPGMRWYKPSEKKFHKFVDGKWEAE